MDRPPTPHQALPTAPRSWLQRAAVAGLTLAALVLLVACGSAPPHVSGGAARAGSGASLHPNSRWTAVDWSELPGFEDDALHEAWNAWLKSCERPGPQFGPLCPDVRLLSLGTGQEQRDWMRARLQAYRVEALAGEPQGLLTGYYEPTLQASRVQREGFRFPLYAMPAQALAASKSGKPWYSRQDIDTLAPARAALLGRELVWLADPVDALVLQLQGSGRVHVLESDGTQRWLRLSYAGSNNHPYQSPGRWLLQQRAVTDASWSGIRTWLARNPQRQQELLWSNPRVVFFREEALNEADAVFGPKGAQGVALTPGRSIAVDPLSIPYGTPVWMASNGAQARLNRLVLAQDTGSAMVGALRADYFAGSGAAAGELAGRLKQGLQLWVLWPR